MLLNFFSKAIIVVIIAAQLLNSGCCVNQHKMVSGEEFEEKIFSRRSKISSVEYIGCTTDRAFLQYRRGGFIFSEFDIYSAPLADLHPKLRNQMQNGSFKRPGNSYINRKDFLETPAPKE